MSQSALSSFAQFIFLLPRHVFSFFPPAISCGVTLLATVAPESTPFALASFPITLSFSRCALSIALRVPSTSAHSFTKVGCCAVRGPTNSHGNDIRPNTTSFTLSTRFSSGDLTGILASILAGWYFSCLSAYWMGASDIVWQCCYQGGCFHSARDLSLRSGSRANTLAFQLSIMAVTSFNFCACPGWTIWGINCIARRGVLGE